MITVNNLTLNYNENETPAIDNISLIIPHGRTTLLLGRSGAGKTSLLRCIGGLQNGYQGTITIDGQQLATMSAQQRAETVGFVFQQFNLFPHLNVLANCVQPLMLVKKMNKQQAEEQARKVLTSVGMQDFINNAIGTLSGGQKQRVAIARALCLNPKVLLLDEPTSALDPKTTSELIQLLKQLEQQGVTMVITSHDMDFVKAMLSNAYLMQNGKIIQHFDASKHERMPEDELASFMSGSS